MRTKIFQAVISITGLALLLGGTFVTPANAAIRIENNGPMQVKNNPRTPYKTTPYINEVGLKNISSFIATSLTNDKFADLWRDQPGTIVERKDGYRLDRQRPIAGGAANIQIQKGGGTFATVIIPAGYGRAVGAQQAEVMKKVRSALYSSAQTTIGQGSGNNVTYNNPSGPRIFTLNGPFSN